MLSTHDNLETSYDSGSCQAQGESFHGRPLFSEDCIMDNDSNARMYYSYVDYSVILWRLFSSGPPKNRDHKLSQQ